MLEKALYMKILQIGVARRLITPSRGTYLAGYGQPIRRATDVRDNLYVSAIFLELEGESVLWLSLDVLAIHDSIALKLRLELAKRCNIDANSILIATTHSHSSPVLSLKEKDNDAFQQAFVSQVQKAVISAAQEACNHLQNAFLSIGEGKSQIGVNRRKPDPKSGKIIISPNEEGPNDDQLTVVAATSLKTKTLLATMVFFASHPTILPPTSRRISAEWPGVMRETIEKEVGGITLFFQGACGNIMSRHQWFHQDEKALQRIGETIGKDVLKIMPQTKRLYVDQIKSVLTKVPLEINARRTKKGAFVGYKQMLKQHLKTPSFMIKPLLDHMYPWKERAIQNSDGKSFVIMTQQAFQIGPWILLSHGSEPFAQTALFLKKFFAEHQDAFFTFVGYANGMVGYLPPAKEIECGGYEIEPAPYFYRYLGPFAKSAETDACKTSIQLLVHLKA